MFTSYACSGQPTCLVITHLQIHVALFKVFLTCSSLFTDDHSFVLDPSWCYFFKSLLLFFIHYWPQALFPNLSFKLLNSKSNLKSYPISCKFFYLFFLIRINSNVDFSFIDPGLLLESVNVSKPTFTLIFF